MDGINQERLGRTSHSDSWRSALWRWATFNLVGVSGVSIQLLILTALINSGFHYLNATALAVQVAVLNNFVWYERWTWSDRPAAGASATLGRLFRFNMTVGTFSIAQNLFFMNVLVGYVGLPLIPANLIGISLCSLINFFISDRLVFKKPAVPTWSQSLADNSRLAEPALSGPQSDEMTAVRSRRTHASQEWALMGVQRP